MESIISAAKNVRHYLHQHPEISCEEKESSDFLFNKLKAIKSAELIRLDNYGIAMTFQGSQPGKHVLIRGDFDALPIQETGQPPYKSEVPGVSHMCGHDGHAAILFGLAHWIDQNPIQVGKATLLFQPAEENGFGARTTLSDPKFQHIQPDFVLALHNLPGYELHTVVIRSGSFTPAVNSIIIRLMGKTAHAAEPELGINPALAMAEITQSLLSLSINDTERADFQLVTPIYTTMGEIAHGISAGEGEMHFTLRAWSNQILQTLENRCEELAHQIGQRHGLQTEVSWTQSFFSSQNDDGVVKKIEQVAQNNGYEVIRRASPFKWGEDFGLFTERYKGAMFGIGAGLKQPALHNPDYDFPDELLPTGIKIFYQLISELQTP